MIAQLCGSNARPLASLPISIAPVSRCRPWHGSRSSAQHAGGRHTHVEPVLATLPGAADTANNTQQPATAGTSSALPLQGASAAAVAIASSAAAAVEARRRQRKLLMQQQQQHVDAAVAHDAAEREGQQQQQQPFSHEMPHLEYHQQQQQQQQQDRLPDNQLKPALQQLLQQMQEAHSSVQQHQREHQQDEPSQQQLTAVAQLTDMIQNLQHPKQLLTVLLVGRGALNVVHHTSAAGVLVRLAQQSQRMQQDPAYRTKVKVCYKQLRKQLEGQLLDFDARGVASLLHATAKLGCCDPHLRAQGLWGDLLHVSASLMEEFSPMQLAMLVHAAARAEPWSLAKPSRRWWAEFFQASQAAMQQQSQQLHQQKRRQRQQQGLSTAADAALQLKLQDAAAAAGQAVECFSPQAFANMIWAMGKLGRRPGADWASVLYRATEPQLAGFTAQGLANIGYGLASMHADGGLPRPGSSWIACYLAAACGQLEGFSSQGMANLLWSLAKLGYCPSREQLGSITAASQALLPKASPQDLSLSVYSFAVLGVKLPEPWWSAFWASSGRCMEAASSQALANMLWAHARLRKVPPSQWLLAFLPCLQQQLPRCSPQATSTVLWAAAQLQLQQLPGAWLDSILARVYQQLLDSECGPQELSLIVQSLQQLQHKPSSKWLDRFYAASQPRLPSFSSKQLATTLAALGSLSQDASPPAAWAAAALAAVSVRIPTLSAPGLCEVMWGLCELRLVPDRELVQRYMAQTAEKMHLMNGAMLARMLRTLVRFGHAPNADWLALLSDESHYYLSSMSPEQLADIIWGFGQVRYSPGPNWLASAQGLGLKNLTGFSPQALVRLLTGLALLRVKPGVQWLGAVGCRVQKMLREFSGHELLQSVGALERLGLAPVPVLVQHLSAGGLATAAAAEALAAATAAAAAAGGSGCTVQQPTAPAPVQQQQQVVPLYSTPAAAAAAAAQTAGPNDGSGFPAAASGVVGAQGQLTQLLNNQAAELQSATASGPGQQAEKTPAAVSAASPADVAVHQIYTLNDAHVKEKDASFAAAGAHSSRQDAAAVAAAAAATDGSAAGGQQLLLLPRPQMPRRAALSQHPGAAAAASR